MRYRLTSAKYQWFLQTTQTITASACVFPLLLIRLSFAALISHVMETFLFCVDSVVCSCIATVALYKRMRVILPNIWGVLTADVFNNISASVILILELGFVNGFFYRLVGWLAVIFNTQYKSKMQQKTNIKWWCSLSFFRIRPS